MSLDDMQDKVEYLEFRNAIATASLIRNMDPTPYLKK